MPDPASRTPDPPPDPPAIAVIGGGPAGLMAAETLSRAGLGVTVYDRMPSVGRKLLMAGRGGLNLTHSEDLAPFLARYGAAQPRLAPAIAAFPPEALRAWSAGLGQPTFVGTSGRVFPQAMKASPLLRAWLALLARQGVRFRPRHAWLGWDDAGHLVIERPDGSRETIAPAATILALGGASWPRLGADGGWAAPLAARGVRITPLRPANCGFTVDWSDGFRTRFAGTPLHNIGLSWNGRVARGEAALTGYGIEGGAVYALSAELRDAIATTGSAIPLIDLRPTLPEAALASRLAAVRARESLSNTLRKAAALPPAAANLLREATGAILPREPRALAALIKAVPLRLTGPASLARAISTAGGVALDDVDDGFMLRALPGTFAAGEMLDWEAPTGGYLLQACFATGVAAAQGVRAWLGRQRG